MRSFNPKLQNNATDGKTMIPTIRPHLQGRDLMTGSHAYITDAERTIRTRASEMFMQSRSGFNFGEIGILKHDEESERQADRVSEQMMSSEPIPYSDEHPLNVERFVSTMGEGMPLESSVQELMESRLGFDFGSIRIHNDEKASKTSTALGAASYTIGKDIFFGTSQYQPNTERGKMLLAHELVHSVQQSAKGPAIQ